MNKKALHKITYGLYVVSSKKGDRINGHISNTVIQVTSEPPKISVCINKNNLTHEFIQESRVFAASVLSRETPLKFIGHFGFKSGRDTDKFKGISYKVGLTGAPIVLENSIGYLEVEVVKTLDVGTHTIFVGKVVDAQIIKEGEPMTYAYYHDVKRGVTPPASPVYIEDDVKEGEKKSGRYRCTVCGYIYDPEKGDSESGIKPGTSFEDLPDDWVCPICGATKDKFEKVGVRS